MPELKHLFFDVRSKASWPNSGWAWELIAFDQSEPGTFDDYARRTPESVRKAFRTKSDSEWEEYLRKGYDSWVAYCNRFNGVLPKGHPIAVMVESAAKIYLDVNWTGAIADHRTLELNLFTRKATLLSIGSQLMCAMYSFGTITVPPGSLEATIGERIGRERVYHLKNLYRVEFDDQRRPTQIMFWDRAGGFGNRLAKFSVLRTEQ